MTLDCPQFLNFKENNNNNNSCFGSKILKGTL